MRQTGPLPVLPPALTHFQQATPLPNPHHPFFPPVVPFPPQRPPLSSTTQLLVLSGALVSWQAVGKAEVLTNFLPAPSSSPPPLPLPRPAPLRSRVIQPLIITAAPISAIPTAIITRAGLSAAAALGR